MVDEDKFDWLTLMSLVGTKILARFLKQNKVLLSAILAGIYYPCEDVLDKFSLIMIDDYMRKLSDESFLMDSGAKSFLLGMIMGANLKGGGVDEKGVVDGLLYCGEEG